MGSLVGVRCQMVGVLTVAGTAILARSFGARGSGMRVGGEMLGILAVAGTSVLTRRFGRRKIADFLKRMSISPTMIWIMSLSAMSDVPTFFLTHFGIQMLHVSKLGSGSIA